MSRDKSIGALSIKIRAFVQSLATGRDIRVPLCLTDVLHFCRALAFSSICAVLICRKSTCVRNDVRQIRVAILYLLQAYKFRQT